MTRIASRCERVRRFFRNRVEFWHWKIRLGSETLHHFIKPRQLFARDWPSAARIERDFVREKICDRVRNDGETQADRHTVAAAEILADDDKKQGQRSQQKSRTQDPHLAPIPSFPSLLS